MSSGFKGSKKKMLAPETRANFPFLLALVEGEEDDVRWLRLCLCVSNGDEQTTYVLKLSKAPSNLMEGSEETCLHHHLCNVGAIQCSVRKK